MKRDCRFRGPLAGSADHRNRPLEASEQPEPGCTGSFLETTYFEDVLVNQNGILLPILAELLPV